MSSTDTTAETVTAAELRQFIERVERLECERAEIAELIKEVMSAARRDVEDCLSFYQDDDEG